MTANAASDENVVVECRDCAFREAVRNLGRARVALDDHETATGHEADWEIRHVAAGVERAGADAGVCGDESCSNPETPLLDYREE
ncbi:hypothetical protein EFA46_011280 (plasmid) [Halarchaeum sp. CBA1220]|uniref:DUF7542 family protein n=1 Tax=Halarchaeum sp. CBA1220 TaxID=1853682 RepID=UPI000F3A85EE|nr:hypothetical protein [Halarchaeum sp. CBA1220]QLC34837.1 hypothetical protein EFA46_011280 [Halarchaeum sp. CBA1220]